MAAIWARLAQIRRSRDWDRYIEQSSIVLHEDSGLLDEDNMIEYRELQIIVTYLLGASLAAVFGSVSGEGQALSYPSYYHHIHHIHPGHT